MMTLKNTIKYFAGILGIVSLLSACEEKLSTDPVDRIVPNTVQDYKEVLIGGLPGVYHAFTELMTDNVEANNYTDFNSPSIYSQWSQPYLWIDQTSSDLSTSPEYLWRWSYADIYKLNLVINNIMDAEGDSALASSIKGEALITRAYNHFMLVNTFAAHYDSSTAASDLGVPIALEALNAGFHYFERNTVAEVYESIEQDMTEGMARINDDYIDQPKYHFTEASSYALYSRIALFKGEWEKALSYAEKAWAYNSTLIDHNDFPNPDEGEAFLLDVHSDNYFTDQSDDIILLRSGFFAANYTRSGYYSNNFILLYDENDLRRNHNFAVTSSANPNVTNIKISRSYQQFNYPLFRTEEVLLTMAEASARIGGTTLRNDAINLLNTLREKRFRPTYYTPYKLSDFATEDELVETVLFERRLELCFEGMRWYDLRRTGRPEFTHTFNGKDYIMQENDLRYVIQIPETELINNPLMVKNPR